MQPFILGGKNAETIVRWTAGLLCAAVFSIASVFVYVKLQSLSFHTRDYAYYAQFAAKLLDRQLSPRYSLNPNGANLLGYSGTDGERHLLQAIHFEPVRFIDAALYFVFRNTWALFILRMFVFLLPVFYLSRVAHVRTKEDTVFAIALMAAYTFYPSAIFTIAYDLRPHGLLAPVVFGLFLSIEYARPRREIVLWFCALLLLREEALVFGLLMLVYAAVRLRAQMAQYYKTLVALFAALSAWYIVAKWYFLWTGYDHDALKILQLNYFSLYEWVVILTMLVGGGVVGVLWLNAYYRWPVLDFARRPGKTFSNWQIEISIPSLLLASLLYMFVERHKSVLYPKVLISNAIYSPKWFLLICVLLMLVIIVWRLINAVHFRKLFLIVFASFVLMAISLNFVFGVSMFAQYERYRSKLPYVDVITANRSRVAADRSKVHVLTDYATHQAFFDYENVYVLERLPAYLVAGQARFYPDNIEILSQIVRDKVEFAFITNESVDALIDLTQDDGSEVKMTIIDENAMFSVYQIGP